MLKLNCDRFRLNQHLTPSKIIHYLQQPALAMGSFDPPYTNILILKKREKRKKKEEIKREKRRGKKNEMKSDRENAVKGCLLLIDSRR